jgi:hypothetical protein
MAQGPPAEEPRRAHGRRWTWPWMAADGVELGGDEKEHQREKILRARLCLVMPGLDAPVWLVDGGTRSCRPPGAEPTCPVARARPRRWRWIATGGGGSQRAPDLASSGRKECCAGWRCGRAAGEGHADGGGVAGEAAAH